MDARHVVILASGSAIAGAYIGANFGGKLPMQSEAWQRALLGLAVAVVAWKLDKDGISDIAIGAGLGYAVAGYL